jgi:hypothetical protein
LFSKHREIFSPDLNAKNPDFHLKIPDFGSGHYESPKYNDGFLSPAGHFRFKPKGLANKNSQTRRVTQDILFNS